MKKIITSFFLLFCFFATAQQEASNWYFGDNAGISFNLDMDTVTAVSGELATEEGCTSISDNLGNLLFYTNGENVYDRQHNIMPNGTGLLGNQSSTQSAIIVPKPQDSNIYYIFTQDTQFQNTADSGFNYSQVDMTLNGGLGDIVTANKNTPLLNEINQEYIATEKISAVLKDCQSRNIFVATLVNDLVGNDLFYVYEVSSSGIVLIGQPSDSGFSTTGNGRGYLKFSPDGTKLVSANVRDGIYLYDFNVINGSISMPRPLTINQTFLNGAIYPYGVEFSSNSQVLYVSTSNDFFTNNPLNNNNPSNHNSALLQYNLSLNNIADINASQTEVEVKQGYRSALQLGPDGRIYKTESSTYNTGIAKLSTIGSPNSIGLMECEYTENAIDLNSNSRQGLPPFITSFFIEKIDIIQDGNSTTSLNLCDGDLYTLIADNTPGATYTWTLDSNPLAETDFDLEIDSPGFYEVLIELNDSNCGVLKGEANVAYLSFPVANQPANIIVCNDDNDGKSNFDFTQQTDAIIGMQDPLDFEVKYYETIDDANAEINSISGSFENSINPQTIHVRAQNINNQNCYNLTSFQVIVHDTPVIDNVNDFTICDQDINAMDGFSAIDLSSFNASVLGTQNGFQYTVTYHPTMADAENGQNALPNNYINQTAFNETIFVRIENNAESTCYNTGNIQLSINPVPDAIDTDFYQCDDINSVDGFTTFNLTEVNETITGNTTDRTVQFYSTLNNAENDIDAFNSTLYNYISNPETIYVRVNNTITGCYNTSTLTLETSDTQISNYNAPEVCDTLNSEDGIHSFNLNDFSSDILNGLPVGLDINYFENYNDALLEQNPLTSPYVNTTPYSQTIFIRVENINACYGINEVLLTINPLPVITEDETLLYCLNTFPNTITLESGTNQTNSNTYTFNWSTGETTESIEINTIGNYTVTATSVSTGCSKSRTITVEPSNIATIEDIVVIDGSINNNQITVITSGEGEYQYALTNQDGVSTSFQTSNVFTNILPGIFTVTIKDIKYNCGSVGQMISIIGFPQYFTPNNDTINDTWQVYGVSQQFQRNSIIHIFDRFGKLITTLNPAGKGWNGTFNGKLMPESDYWFSVTLEDGRVYRNHFTLKR